MCGVAGAVALRDGLEPLSLDVLHAMAAALRHRGPDEFGLFRDRSAALVHARLSIIDLATGQQPLSNEDGTLWISFNGEIFNYVELRDELGAAGHRFRTRSDTEVIVHAFEEWGEDAFARFNGQFAVALWDAPNRTLVLARDRLGVRPLHFCEDGGRLWFASEVKALFAGAVTLPRALDPVGLAETFTFWACVAPQTPFAGVAELEPGHVRTISPHGTTDRAFWTPAFPVDRGDAGRVSESAERVRDALERSVRLRMLRADVPVGCYVSGGLDSSVVASLGRKVKGASFHTFSIRFEDAEYDETRWQREVVAQIGSEHHEVLVRRGDIAAAFPDVVAHAERPLLRTAPAPLYLLSRLVHDAGIKVVLTGEGADETFGGYDLFREGKVRRFWGRQPDSTIRPRLLHRLYPYLARSPVAQQALSQAFFGKGRARWREPGFAHRLRWDGAAALQRLFRPDVRASSLRVNVVERLLASVPPDFSRWSFLAQDQYLEMRTLLSAYLLSSQGDRMLMAHSVEGRFPFLDVDVVALANALPPEHKLRGLDEKHVLKRAAAGLVPGSVLDRKKQPYRAPDALAFVGRERPGWIDDALAPAAVEAAGVFEPRAVEGLWKKCRAMSDAGQFSNADNMALVGVLSTQILYARVVRAAPERKRVAFRTVVDCLSPGHTTGGPGEH